MIQGVENGKRERLYYGFYRTAMDFKTDLSE